MNENLVSILIRNAEKFPQKAAIIDAKGNVETYSDLLKNVRARANFLREKKITFGDKILVFVPMSIELYRWLIAIWYVGGCAVFVDAWAKKERLENACRIAEPRAFLGIPKAHLVRIFSKEVRKIPLKIFANTKKNFSSLSNEYFRPSDVTEDTDALITFTTGSTGMPKAARRTHGFLLSQHEILKKYLSNEPGEIDMPALPIFALHNLACGMASVLPDFDPRHPEKISPEKIFSQVRKHGITTTVGSPIIYEKLADFALREKKNFSLKKIHLGGAPVFPDSAEKLVRAFPDAEIEIVYGSTEAEPVSLISANNFLSAKKNISPDGLLVGKKISDIEVMTIPRSGEKIALKTGETGEICVTGRHVLKEYFNSQEAQRENKFLFGGKIWHRTGDAGRIDAEENIFLLGRAKEAFELGGKIFFPFPLEYELRQIPGVRLGTVVKAGEKIFVALEAEEKFSFEMVKKKMVELGLEEAEIFVLKKIPRDPRHNSKIDYDKLKKIIRKKFF